MKVFVFLVSSLLGVSGFFSGSLDNSPQIEDDFFFHACAAVRVQCEPDQDVVHTQVKVCVEYGGNSNADRIIARGRATDASKQAGKSACGISVTIISLSIYE